MPRAAFDGLPMKTGGTSESLLQRAARHVASGSQIVERQRERIVQLKLAGGSTLEAEHTLRVFLDTLEIFEDHQRELQQDRQTLVKELCGRSL